MERVEHYVTYFDVNYLPRGLALLHSLQTHAEPFHLWVLCLDEETESLLEDLGLPCISPVHLAALEAADEELRQTRSSRSRIEYYFTLTPALIRYLLDREGMDRLTYLDADLFFFSDTAELFAEAGDAPITVVEHRFPARLSHLEVYGRFNVGWLTFRNLPEGRDCLDWWRERTIEWCYDRVEGDRFADQKYLDRWPELFGDSLQIMEHPGANVGPWNLGRHHLSQGARGVLVDEQPLVFFHFHGFRQLGPHTYDPNVRAYGEKVSRVLEEAVITPYVRALDRVSGWLGDRSPLASGVRRPTSGSGLRDGVVGSMRRLAQPVRRWVWVARGVAVKVDPQR